MSWFWFHTTIKVRKIRNLLTTRPKVVTIKGFLEYNKMLDVL